MSVVEQGRPLTPAAQRVLDVAGTLFYERGIGGVGMELIAAEAGVTKKTVYDRFGSKEALIVAYLRTRDRRWRAFVTERVTAAPGPRAGILATYEALDTWQRRHNARGCSMVNACAELPDPEHPVHRVAAEEKAWLRDVYRRLVTEARYDDPESLADRLLILHEGAIVTYSIGGLPDSARIARDTADALLPR
ncbi:MULTISPECIES: TetR/AcrR family transcriptional regulator [Actinomadura]|uniref:TetR/AcrR family transcriptional regulator n=1 Tax=Actinomadura yumaensis TaxID=111807 RepID=A0ABW2CH68_9ACTN|nr:TetR/AcrR family transcriptional regulator [Actinomadura sp. J1-007]MWK33153.1 TetR family transcriptional regulator [Actinomadura sp. J1-007]